MSLTQIGKMMSDKSPALQLLLDGYCRDLEINSLYKSQSEIAIPSILKICIKYIDGQMIINGKINYLKSIENLINLSIVTFPKTEIEGIKDCYIYTDKPSNIYYRISKFLTFNTYNIHCTSINYDKVDDGKQNEIEIPHLRLIESGDEKNKELNDDDNNMTHCLNVKGNMSDIYEFEINFKIFLSRNYQSFNDKKEGGKIYVLRIKRIRGDYITFWRIRKKLTARVLCYFEALPQQILHRQTNRDDYHLDLKLDLHGTAQPLHSSDPLDFNLIPQENKEYEYSIYNDEEERKLGDDENADFVWITY